MTLRINPIFRLNSYIIDFNWNFQYLFAVFYSVKYLYNNIKYNFLQETLVCHIVHDTN